MLEDSSALWDSVRFYVDGEAVVWGSDLVYAGIHNDGGKTRPHVIRPSTARALRLPNGVFVARVNHPGSNIPQRQFVGLSEQNAEDMEAEAELFLGDLLQF